MMEWGGSSLVWVNLFHWFWAIAESGSPASVSTEDLASWLGCSLEQAAADIAKAERHYRANVRSNQRTHAFQRYERFTKRELVASARSLSLRVSGFDLKEDVIQMLVDYEFPNLTEVQP